MSNPATTELTPLNATIAKLRAQGKTYREISDEVGISAPAIHRRVNKNQEIQRFIEAYHKRLVHRSLPKAVKNVEHAISAYTDPQQKDDQQLKDHGFKASLEVLKSAGLLPSQSQAFFIQQVFNDNRAVVVTPEVDRVLDLVGLSASRVIEEDDPQDIDISP